MKVGQGRNKRVLKSKVALTAVNSKHWSYTTTVDKVCDELQHYYFVARIFLVSTAIGWVVPFTTEVKFMGIISKKRGLNWGVGLKIF